MTRADFLNDMDAFLGRLRKVWEVKNLEYGQSEDVNHNFNVGKNTMIHPSTPEEALWGMANKHLVATIDIIRKVGRGIVTPVEVCDEKIGDLINYLLLARGMLVERNQLIERAKHEYKGNPNDGINPG